MNIVAGIPDEPRGGPVGGVPDGPEGAPKTLWELMAKSKPADKSASSRAILSREQIQAIVGPVLLDQLRLGNEPSRDFLCETCLMNFYETMAGARKALGDAVGAASDGWHLHCEKKSKDILRVFDNVGQILKPLDGDDAAQQALAVAAGFDGLDAMVAWAFTLPEA